MRKGGDGREKERGEGKREQRIDQKKEGEGIHKEKDEEKEEIRRVKRIEGGEKADGGGSYLAIVWGMGKSILSFSVDSIKKESNSRLFSHSTADRTILVTVSGEMGVGIFTRK